MRRVQLFAGIKLPRLPKSGTSRFLKLGEFEDNNTQKVHRRTSRKRLCAVMYTEDIEDNNGTVDARTMIAAHD